MEELDPDAILAIAKQAKALLRKRARNLRGSMPKAGIAKRSQAIVERLQGLEAIQTAKRVALFYPITGKNEVDLMSLDEALRGRGVELYYPSLDRAERSMTFRAPPDPHAMQERGMLVAEPDPNLPEASKLDVIVVPALLVDSRGYRIGYGAGFYDRTLPRFCPPALSIGVAFEFQIAAELPIEPCDVACDMIVTDARVLKG